MWWCWDRSREPLVSHRPAPYRTIRRCIRLRRFGLQRSPIGAPERLHAMRHGRLRAGPQDPNHRDRRLLRARRQRPRRRRAAEQHDELAAFHCPMPPVLPNERNSTPRYGRGLLRCGISIRPMTAVGHSLQIRPRPLVHKCPLCINTDRKFWALGFVAMGHKQTFARRASSSLAQVA